MTLAEPMTMLTDYGLAALGGGFGASLWRQASPPGGASGRLWGAALLATGAGALLGGTSHGFAPHLSAATFVALWRATYVAIGLANLLILAGAVVAMAAPRFHPWLLAVLGLRFAVYAPILSIRRDFRYVVYDYALTLSCLLALAVYSWIRRRDPAAPWILAGVLVSFLGAGIQHGRFAPHRHFNHNDLFHVVQMLGLYLFYRGGLLLRDRASNAR